MQKMVITVAVCGAETTREQNPNLPLTPAEIANSTYEAFLAGASICHLHVRDKDGNATMDVGIFRETIDLIRKKCDIIVEVTTGGGVGDSDDERLRITSIEPEMASLDCGTVNFGNDYIVNSLPTIRRFAQEFKKRKIRPTLECFDLSHIYNAEMAIKEGLVEAPLHYGLVLNVPGAARYDIETLDFFVRRLPKGSYWTVMGIGRATVDAHFGALALGGFMRVGFEDNVYYSKGVLANSNAQLVERAAKIAVDAGCEIAKPSDVRKMLKLK